MRRRGRGTIFDRQQTPQYLSVTLPGCWAALVFACLSFTPSLLPRGGFLQGMVCGITPAIGYGLGVLAASIWRAFADRDARRPRPSAWRIFYVTAAVLLAASFALGQHWQSQIRHLTGVTDYSLPLVLASPFVAVVMFWLLLRAGRGLRALYRRTVGLLNRWIGHRAATTLGWLLVAAVTYLVVSGFLLQGAVNAANQAFSVRNTDTDKGTQQRTSSLRSGGPGSLIGWNTLGREGRNFTGPWISYLVDQAKARVAGRTLFDTVYDRWSKLPTDSRPRLFVAGESLGSVGGETAFSGEYDPRNRTAGTLFAGPPNFNTLFREFSDHRDPGSPEVQPVYKDGRTVRFTNSPATVIPPAGQPWNGPRVLYLMHPSDPIVWWSPRLILSQPDWIAETSGSDVVKEMVWIPFVTFWQVSADLPFSTGVPSGHGHKYTTEYVDGTPRSARRQEAPPARVCGRILTYMSPSLPSVERLDRVWPDTGPRRNRLVGQTDAR